MQPNYNREYKYNQYFLFAEDSFRLTPRVTLNYGLRYENYGSPRNVGPDEGCIAEVGYRRNAGRPVGRRQH